MSWMFAIINRRLAEIFFEEKSGGRVECPGYCYVKRSEYKSRKERDYIREDTKRLKLRWKDSEDKPTIIKWDLPWTVSRW